MDMEKRVVNIVWEEDRAVTKIGDFVIELTRSNNRLLEAKVKEVLSYTVTHAEIPYFTNIEGNYIVVNIGFNGLKKYELSDNTLTELY